MKILVYMGHPAHFYLFRNTIVELSKNGHSVKILIQKKEILEELLKSEGFEFTNILREGRSSSKIGMLRGMIKRDYRILKHCLKNKPDILLGTSVEFPHIGKLLGIPSINFNEDDCPAVPLYCKLSYPLSSFILAPENCNTGKWENKTIAYKGYHELSYLYPKNFPPDKKYIKDKIDLSRKFFLIRFSKLAAHHDEGKTGINAEIAKRVIDILTSHGNVYITSERELEPEFEKYRIGINPIHMHHALYYADMYIGDSQTMTAEAAVLGTPALRFNDFVGRLSYLEELEHKYNLTYGIKTSEPEKLYGKIEEILKMKNRKEVWRKRREKMLKDKIDVTAFFVWFIENYPKSAKIIKKNPEYQERFR